MFTGLKQSQQPADSGKREKELSKLAAKRERIIDAYEDGRLTKQEFARRIDAIAEAQRDVEARMPAAAPPAIDERRLIAGLTRWFAPARFGRLPFEQQRAELKRVVRQLSVTDGAIDQVTASGAFLQEYAHTNLEPRSTSPYWLRSPGPAKGGR